MLNVSFGIDLENHWTGTSASSLLIQVMHRNRSKQFKRQSIKLLIGWMAMYLLRESILPTICWIYLLRLKKTFGNKSSMC